VPDADEFWRSDRGPVTPTELDPWTLPRILDRRANSHPDIALFHERSAGRYRPVSWKEFRDDVAEIAAGLHALGLGEGDRIALLGNSSTVWIACDLAILAIGGITVGLYPTSAQAEVTAQLDHVGAAAVIIQDGKELDRIGEALRVPGKQRQLIVIDGSCPAGEGILLAEVKRTGAEFSRQDPDVFSRLVQRGKADDPSRLLFTSGSTGKPKAVIHTHRSIILASDGAVIRHPEMRSKPQRVLAFLPLSHVSPTINNIVIPLITQTVAYFGGDPQAISELIREVRPTYLPLMPRHYEKLGVDMIERVKTKSRSRQALYATAMRIGRPALRKHWAGQRLSPGSRMALQAARRLVFRPLLAEAGLADVSRAQTTSAAMPESVISLWAIWGLDLRDAYGSTESAGAISAQLDHFPRPGNIGRKLPAHWYELKLADDGEILFRSPFVFKGYWNDPAATAEVLREGWLHTGDIGEFGADGNLRIVGRTKDVINTSAGKSLSPQKIELALKDSPFVSEAVAIGDGRRYITALIELAEPVVSAWTRERNIAASGYAGLAASSDVKSLIESEVALANGKLARVAQVKRFTILPRPLDVTHEEVTATRKVRRQIVERNFKREIDSMYDSSDRELIEGQVGGGPAK
jgi:long-chain acyl-CoA synthetase